MLSRAAPAVVTRVLTELLDIGRKEEALRMPSREHISMAEIAYAPGYNEQSSFNLTFKR